MPKFARLLLIGFFVGTIDTAAAACEAQFDPRSNLLSIPCLTVFGETNFYSANLRDTGDRNFTIWSVLPVDVENPRVIALRILTTPIPVAVIVAASTGPCTIGFERPTFVRTGNNIDIRMKVRIPGEPVRSIADCVVEPPVAEAVHLIGVSNPTAHTYSINGIAIAPDFSF